MKTLAGCASVGEQEIAALTHGQRSASVVAKTKATVIYMRAQDFRHFVTEIPALGEQVHKLVAERSQTLPDDPGQPESV